MWNPANPTHCEMIQAVREGKEQSPAYKASKDGVMSFSDKKRQLILQGKKSAPEVMQALRFKLWQHIQLEKDVINAICENIIYSGEKAAIAKVIAILDEMAYGRTFEFDTSNPDLEQYSMSEADYARSLAQ